MMQPVACNIYLTAGGVARHAKILSKLLRDGQNLCQQQQALPNRGDADRAFYADTAAAVVHAYADPVYNRSSFHLAGTAMTIAHVVSRLALQAMSDLKAFENTEDELQHNYHHHHPYIGLVDHIAVMPIDEDDEENNQTKSINSKTTTHSAETFAPQTPSGWAARRIGEALEHSGVQVHYYGSADPLGSPLATVRRERTSFFQSVKTHSKNASETQVSIVGAPFQFVENFNIRLQCSQSTAQSLTRHVRNPEKGIEALTLRYKDNSWEVACNLLRPNKASIHDLQKVVNEWQDLRNKTATNETILIERMYRVGTTAEECRRVLTQVMSDNHDNVDDARAKHDARVKEKLNQYFIDAGIFTSKNV